MAKFNAALQYADTQISSAGRLKSIQMLLEGGARFLRQARNNEENRSENIIRSQNILAQLQMALRPEQSDAARLLFLLYDYMYLLLDSDDIESVKNTEILFEHLCNTFKMLRKGLS